MRLTDEQLDEWEKKGNGEEIKGVFEKWNPEFRLWLPCHILLDLITEVREGRKVVEMPSLPQGEEYTRCPEDCGEWVQVGDNYCAGCGVHLAWKEAA